MAVMVVLSVVEVVVQKGLLDATVYNSRHLLGLSGLMKQSYTFEVVPVSIQVGRISWRTLLNIIILY